MRLLMDLIGRFLSRPSPIDHDELRAQMSEEDPAFSRVRDIHHDAMSALAAKQGADSLIAQRAADGLAIRRERQFWEHHGGVPKTHDDG